MRASAVVSDASVFTGSSALGGQGTGELSALDVRSGTVTSRRPIGYDPSDLAIAVSGYLVFTVDGDDKVRVVRVR